MNQDVWRVLKWIGAACLGVLAVLAIRKGYLDSQPTRTDLEAGLDMRNAAIKVAARHGIAEDNVAIMFKNPDDKLRIADITVVEQLDRVARQERERSTGTRPLRVA